MFVFVLILNFTPNLSYTEFLSLSFSRYQLWALNDHCSRSSRWISEDLSVDKSQVYPAILSGNKLAGSHPHDEKEAETRNIKGPIRPSRLLEDKRWLPRETFVNQETSRFISSWEDNTADWVAKSINFHSPFQQNTCSSMFTFTSYDSKLKTSHPVEVTSLFPLKLGPFSF